MALSRKADLTWCSDPKVSRVIKLWEDCVERDGEWRSRFQDDLKFDHGDSDNGWQWDQETLDERELLNIPSLTINIAAQHNLQIINAGRMEKSSMEVKALGNGATKEAADVYDQLVKAIEQRSSGQEVYNIARGFQVKGGVGYWRILTRYEDTSSFNQEIYLGKVEDPLMVYLDPLAGLCHGGDAGFGFICEKLRKEEFDKLHPDAPEGVNSGFKSMWVDKDYVVVTEFFERVRKSVTLLSFVVEGERKVLRSDFMSPEMRKKIMADPLTKKRKVDDWTVQWTKFLGETVLEEKDWVGTLGIPIIRALGTRVIIDNQIDIKGHTRGIKDAQRMYNYNASASVEYGALQSKSPWLAPIEAIDGHTEVWSTANTEHHSVLPYRSKDPQSDVPIPPPERVAPPQIAPVFESGMQNAMQQMMMASGQYQNTLGAQGNERTGAAIDSRQGQADVSTYHFRSNFEAAQVWTAQLMIEMFPRVYDTKRVVLIMGETEEPVEVQIDPTARQAFQLEQLQDAGKSRMIFNPNIGKYGVKASTGDANSRREKTVGALTLLLTQAPALTGLIGDLLLKAMNIPEADEAAARLRRMVPPQALGQGPTPNEQGLKKQLDQATTALQLALQEQAKTTLKLLGKDEMRDIDVYDAETKRIAALVKGFGLDPDTVKQLLSGVGKDAEGTSLLPILDANKDTISGSAPSTPAEEPPHPDAQQAPDGQWYMTDPTRVGRYMKIAPLVGKTGG